jgi:RES domain-containing protein
MYTALSPEGAIAELDKHAAEFAGARRRRDLVSVQVTVDGVLDLTSRWTRVRHGISLATLTGDAPADLAACRGLARREVLGGRYGAILAPSAAPGGGVNLMLYVEHTGHLRDLTNGPDRVTITPGYRWPGTLPS